MEPGRIWALTRLLASFRNTIWLLIMGLFVDSNFPIYFGATTEGIGGVAALIAVGIFLLVFLAISFRSRLGDLCELCASA